MNAAPLQDPVVAALRRVPCSARLLVAYSGGIDSHVLLHGLSRLRTRPGWTLSAAHVDHQLDGRSPQWARHCQHICDELQVPLRQLRVDARARRGASPEAAARDARYRALSELLEPGELLLTGQHLDDQSETILLQLMRGAGPAGLAAMPRARALARGWLMRPLLNVSREQISAYASRHQLEWLDDPSNTDLSIDRNFLRRQVLPELRQRWPMAAGSLAAAAARCAESADLLMALAQLDSRHGLAAGSGLAVHSVLTLPVPRQRNLVRCWLRVEGARAAPAWALTRIVEELLPTADSGRAVVAWGGFEVRPYRGRLHAMETLPAVPAGWRQALTREQPSALPDGTRVELVSVTGGIDARLLKGRTVEVGFRVGGERLRLVRGGPRRTLKNLFREAGVPPWERSRWPLLFCDGALLAVAGRWTSVEFTVREEAVCGLSFRWQRLLPSDSL